VNGLLSKEGVQNFFKQIMKLWVEPEIKRRRQTTGLPHDFKIFHCLIRFPKDRRPIVEFNNEIGWIASIKKAPGTSFEKGQPVHLHEIQKIVAVNPPEVDGHRVAFIYFFWTGRDQEYKIIFDFTPKIPEKRVSEKDKKAWMFSKAIAESLQAVLTRKTISIHPDMQMILQKIGLWVVPALLPYPMSKIMKQLAEDKIEEASTTLLEHCTSEYIETLSSKWWTIEQYEKRKKLILHALDAHKNKQYDLSIHALLPQIEGIITDWIYTKLPETEIPWRQKSKTRKFKDLVLSRPPTAFTYRRIVESTINFILGGPVLNTFKQWLEQIDKAFPGRHVVQHGKYDESLFTEENSIKLFLLLDTVHFIITSGTSS